MTMEGWQTYLFCSKRKSRPRAPDLRDLARPLGCSIYIPMKILIYGASAPSLI
jgi:hypothetical protein